MVSEHLSLSLGEPFQTIFSSSHVTVGRYREEERKGIVPRCITFNVHPPRIVRDVKLEMSIVFISFTLGNNYFWKLKGVW